MTSHNNSSSSKSPHAKLFDPESHTITPLPKPTNFPPPPPPHLNIDLSDPLQLGIFYHENTPFLEASTYYFSLSASQGSSLAQFLFAIALRHGWGIEKDEQVAFAILLHAADSAIQDVRSLEEKRKQLGTGTIRRIKNADFTMAILELSRSFKHGLGVTKSKETAFFYLKIAAAMGDLDAQLDLAESYMKGEGVKTDKRLAAEWYRKAIRQGADLPCMDWLITASPLMQRLPLRTNANTSRPPSGSNPNPTALPAQFEDMASLSSSQLVHCRFIDELVQQLSDLVLGTEHVGRSQSSICELHEAPLYYFCNDCGEAICSDCAVIDTKMDEYHLSFMNSVNKSTERQAEEKESVLLSYRNELQTESEMIRVTLDTLKSHLSQASQIDIIKNSQRIIDLINKQHSQPQTEFVLPTVSMTFESDVVPQYNHAYVKISNFRARQEKNEIFYSEPFKASGLTWRLKVYCSGNGPSRGLYLSVFVELIQGFSLPSKYQYKIEMLKNSTSSDTSSHANVSREYASDFEIGECWGYNRFYRLDLLEEGGFWNEHEDAIEFNYHIRAPTYSQKCRDLELYCKFLESSKDQRQSSAGKRHLTSRGIELSPTLVNVPEQANSASKDLEESTSDGNLEVSKDEIITPTSTTKIVACAKAAEPSQRSAARITPSLSNILQQPATSTEITDAVSTNQVQAPQGIPKSRSSESLHDSSTGRSGAFGVLTNRREDRNYPEQRERVGGPASAYSSSNLKRSISDSVISTRLSSSVDEHDGGRSETESVASDDRPAPSVVCGIRRTESAVDDESSATQTIFSLEDRTRRELGEHVAESMAFGTSLNQLRSDMQEFESFVDSVTREVQLLERRVRTVSRAIVAPHEPPMPVPARHDLTSAEDVHSLREEKSPSPDGFSEDPSYFSSPCRRNAALRRRDGTLGQGHARMHRLAEHASLESLSDDSDWGVFGGENDSSAELTRGFTGSGSLHNEEELHAIRRRRNHHPLSDRNTHSRGRGHVILPPISRYDAEDSVEPSRPNAFRDGVDRHGLTVDLAEEEVAGDDADRIINELFLRTTRRHGVGSQDTNSIDDSNSNGRFPSSFSQRDNSRIAGSDRAYIPNSSSSSFRFEPRRIHLPAAGSSMIRDYALEGIEMSDDDATTDATETTSTISSGTERSLRDARRPTRISGSDIPGFSEHGFSHIPNRLRLRNGIHRERQLEEGEIVPRTPDLSFANV
ncbi:hypothetical protein HDU76_011066 [Blyttiomyces sp. JEL0837]|nr:hypothetical protein HDU76_011066 [Blyttiomyces sp. JEL0837]